MNKTSHPKSKYYFKKQDSLGLTDASDDDEYLYSCFIDTGTYDLLEKFNDRKCLVLGRTGIGKTALLKKLAEKKSAKVIVINPESLAMQHITNNNMIKYFDELDIELNTFFKLLWRHALCVEIFIHHFNIADEYEFDEAIEKIRYRLKSDNIRHLRALDYIVNWRKTFWKENESHVTQMVSATEEKLSGELGANAKIFKAGGSKDKKISKEQKTEYHQIAQKIVDESQMEQVSNLISMLNEVIDFQKKQYYVLIDNLDEGWVDSRLRYKLIKALIETVKDLNRQANIKPIVVLREDLLDHVFSLTDDVGFQEEKYKSLYLKLRWTRPELINLIDLRINQLLSSRYSKKTLISHKDILPPSIYGQPVMDYILDRTLLRPRDIIEFFNACVAEATDADFISEQMILEAEHNYSRERLKSVYYEWKADYPDLKSWVKLLRNKERRFSVSDIPLSTIKELCDDYVLSRDDVYRDGLIHDRFHALASRVSELGLSESDFRKHLVHAFFNIGLVGLSRNVKSIDIWSSDPNRVLDLDDIEEDTQVLIHPCFWSALKTKAID